MTTHNKPKLYLVVDGGTHPALVVLMTADEKEAHATAKRYCENTGRDPETVVVGTFVAIESGPAVRRD